MEEVSDKIRHGEPVGIVEAIAAIEYQRQRKLQQPLPLPLWKRVVRFFLPNAELCRTQGGVDSATDATPPP